MYLISIALQWKLGHVVDRFHVQNALLWKNYTRRTFCIVTTIEIKANLGCQKKKNWAPVSLGRFLRFLSRFLRQHFLRQVRWQLAGRLWSLMLAHALQSSWFTVHREAFPQIHTPLKQSWEIHEKPEAGLNFLQKFLLKNCFLWKLRIYFLLSFFNSAVPVPFRHLQSPLPQNFPK